jgi:DNA-binding NarL/FixJ family response regulator
MVERVIAPGDSRRFGVLLVDNHDVAHVGLRVLLRGQAWVGRIVSARRGAEAVWLARRYTPAVAIVDVFVGEELGVHVCRAIRAQSPEVRVLLLSASTGLTQHAALAAGAAGVIAKDSTTDELLSAVRDVARDGRGFLWRPEAVRGPLSVRQRRILTLMAEGATNRDIGASLGLAADTVKQHTSAIYRRLGVRNRAEAVHHGQRLGLLTGEHAIRPGLLEPAQEMPV